MKVVDSVNIESKYSTLKITEYRTVFGQTIYIKSINGRTETNSVSKPIDKEGSIKISIKEIESILKDEALRRITLKKALDIVWLKYQGEDEKKIVKRQNIILPLNNVMESSNFYGSCRIASRKLDKMHRIHLLPGRKVRCIIGT